VRKILVPAIVTLVLLHFEPLLPGQAGAQPGRGQAATALAARMAAPWDITGYWVALITDDWRYRMLTPPKGNVDYLPVTVEARRAADQWDPAKDEAAGEQCKAYGAGGIMRLPGRLHIAWEDDNTLKMDIDTGDQTRRFVFGGAQLAAAQPVADKATWQGSSVARWELPGAGGRGPGGFFGAAAAPTNAHVGQLKIVTTGLRPGYVRKNGVPYSASAVITEYIVRLVDTDGQEYLALTTMVDDPKFFQVPYIKTYEFKKQTDARGWNPTQCSAK
jgi:hypothetical protein